MAKINLELELNTANAAEFQDLANENITEIVGGGGYKDKGGDINSIKNKGIIDGDGGDINSIKNKGIIDGNGGDINSIKNKGIIDGGKKY